MAGHTGLWATSAECINKAGKAYDSVACDEAMINELCLQAESVINCMTRYNWSDEFTAPATTATLSADVWYILGEAESNLVAIYMILHNMEGLSTGNYPSRIVVEDMINVLRDRFLSTISILRDKKTQDFLKGATV